MFFRWPHEILTHQLFGPHNFTTHQYFLINFFVHLVYTRFFFVPIVLLEEPHGSHLHSLMFKPSPFLTHSPSQLFVLLFSFYPIRSHQTETDYTTTSSSNNLVFCWWWRWFGQALKSLVHPEPVELPINLQPSSCRQHP